MTKFFLNPTFKMLYFVNKMSQSEIFFGLIQASNTSKHTYRNKGAIMKASRKAAHDNVCFILLVKMTFFPQQMQAQ